MRIAVNTRLLLPNRLDGIGWFTFQTLKRITENHPEHQFIFLFDRPYNSQFIFSNNIIPVIVRPPARHPVLWFMWLEWSVTRILKKYKADLFLSPDGFLPLFLKIPTISVIHDLNFEHRPLDLPITSRWYYRYFFPKFARKANRIATVSEFSKKDIATCYHIPTNKIDVVYNGSHEMYKPVSNEIKLRVKKQYTGGSEYFIFIGSIHPRKNIDGLVRGFDLFRKKTGLDFKLLIVGDKFFKNSDLETDLRALKFRSDIIFTGRKEPEELSLILASAWALAFVPHFEGFGIPLLEAMHCNVPSVASNTTSLPEVAGNTAIYINPADDISIAEGLTKMATDLNLREELIINCSKQRQKFSWDNTAQKLWECIQKTVIHL